LREGFAQVFWRDRRAVLLDARDRESSVRTTDLAGHDYLGPHLDLIERLRTYRGDGVRRCVLLQGPPGTGKSTFCRHAARELADRCLFLSAGFLQDVSVADWDTIVAFLRPDMVVVDDVDRVGDRCMAAKLRLFEDAYCDIPTILMTANEPEELPEPMKRPGRIDQILEVNAPDADARAGVIQKLAQRVGVDVPEGQVDRLNTLLSRESPAHVVEILRRAKTVGWESVSDMPGDQTFGE
jgi:chromosomal replication initiation ATPase DnaA